MPDSDTRLSLFYGKAKLAAIRGLLSACRTLLAARTSRIRPTHTFLFVGGLHRSGTSLVHRLICSHPWVSGFSHTGVPEDEGQHLQNLYPPAKHHGGPGRFAFDETAHLTECDLSLVKTCRTSLWNCWAPNWDISKTILVEKSPPNLVRARFFQTVFPGAKFIFVIRHPLTVSASTQKWTKQPMAKLIKHWVRAHRIFLDDLAQIDAWAWLRYEDLTADPKRILTDLFKFIGVPAIPPVESISDRNSPYLRSIGSIDTETADQQIIDKFGYQLRPPYYRLAPGLGGLNVSETVKFKMECNRASFIGFIGWPIALFRS